MPVVQRIRRSLAAVAVVATCATGLLGAAVSPAVADPPPAMTVTLSPSATTVYAGSPVSAYVFVHNMPATTTLTLGLLPLRVTGSLSSSTLPAGPSTVVTLSLHTWMAMTPGTYTITVTARSTDASGPVTVTASLALTVFNPSNPNCLASYTPLTPVPIPDNNTIMITSATMPACPAPQASGLAHVQVIVQHPHRGDLTIWLVNPNGFAYTLRTQNFREQGADINQIYDVNLGSSFASTSPRTWQLRINDHSPGQAGTLVAWAISI